MSGWDSPNARRARQREHTEALQRQTWRARLAAVAHAVGVASVTGQSVRYELSAVAERREAHARVINREGVNR